MLYYTEMLDNEQPGSDDWSAMAGEMDDACSRERRAEIERLWRVHVLVRL